MTGLPCNKRTKRKRIEIIGSKITREIEVTTNERTAIHKNLSGFYIQGNKLLDKSFLKWYMSEFYSINLDSEYTIHLIDTDINMLKMNSNEHVKLKEEKTYTVVSN